MSSSKSTRGGPHPPYTTPLVTISTYPCLYTIVPKGKPKTTAVPHVVRNTGTTGPHTAPCIAARYLTAGTDPAGARQPGKVGSSLFRLLPPAAGPTLVSCFIIGNPWAQTPSRCLLRSLSTQWKEKSYLLECPLRTSPQVAFPVVDITVHHDSLSRGPADRTPSCCLLRSSSTQWKEKSFFLGMSIADKSANHVSNSVTSQCTLTPIPQPY